MRFGSVVSAIGIMTLMLGAGCRSAAPEATSMTRPAVPVPPAMPNTRGDEQWVLGASPVVLPLDGNIAGYLPTYKRFGEYFEDRFRGYHVGEDYEVPSEDLGPGEVQEVPIRAIADGAVRYAGWVRGYGGVVVIAHDAVGADRINAIYGHLDIASVRVQKESPVKRGEVIGVIGEGGTRETDGERQHLHFALYAGDDLRLQGYERDAQTVRDWINPHDFFIRHGVLRAGLPTAYSALTDPQGKRIFHLDFIVPDGWDVEYIPSLQALNLYAVSGAGAARERSQVLIRYFDAADFLTLSTVTVHSNEDVMVGQENYIARRYVIEKKPEVAAFKDQPAWRNVKHTVTDFRDRNGRTRYYVVAANPALERAVYDAIITSMRITNP